ncbi:origin recognition complex subunit 3 [Tribolium castaneum]|uniref:Origin recognition complex subunit 3 n=1 Tax=Tribolium castaneum TaxID=7070 RepID=D6WJ81_TRICA|nr:PREDICTED: origin recognition complex subunit 3 [Tribolium castaneum]EFA03157.1 Origin recognition complex subunit 3-like Protein [Tribolium castaneum]|eukprot:XP_975229.1 PREDICTED: origin recognition complex subunit 3 [Tribolium castaneum]
MAATVSVSKGVFVFKNGAKAASKKSRTKDKRTQSLYCDSLWYKTYKSLWESIETQIQELNNAMFSNILCSLVNFLKNCYKDTVSEIPAAALLTGINMPDHSVQFKTLKKEIKRSITPHVVTLSGEDCHSLKYLVEIMVNQLVKSEQLIDEDSDSDTRQIKKSQCSFTLLQAWYEELYQPPGTANSPKKQKTKHNKNIIVVIIPDFENFAPKVLQDFIQIASSYLNVLPFVFVFGVATSLNAVHRSLPCYVSSRINIQVFHSTPSTVYLNNILENILFSRQCPFHLGGKVFNLFTDIFLFYDLSVSGFIQNFKYAMLEHFCYGNVMALCQRKHIKQIISDFSHDDLENARRLMSFRKLVESESPEARIALLTDDNYFRNVLLREVRKIVAYLPNLHLFLRCLHVLVGDLPKAPLGKQVRELYACAVSRNITKSQEYKECFQLLAFQSRDELCNKVKRITDLIVNNSEGLEVGRVITDRLNRFLDNLHNLDQEEDENEVAQEGISELMGRLQLREKLLQMSKQNKPMNKYEKIRSGLLNFLSEQFEIYLQEPTDFHFHEIFFFNDISVQTHIIGSHRAAIHTALNDPHVYLQCPCCEIATDSVILPSMPDISIVYKLHLECGKMINLYDWLQSFLSIVDPQETEDNPKVSPQLQARFTQAVAELEYLGFIKSSKRKTDHVARLTWGG